jgi:hypothetical protein
MAVRSTMTEAARPLPRYYFHITGRFEIEDDEGEEFPDVAAAMVLALRMASELAADRGNYHGCFVRVTDDKGDELARIQMRTV